jgi:hypothetical protein
MTNLPRLELTEDPNKNNDYIIFRHSSLKGKKNIQTKSVTKKCVRKKKHGTRKKKTKHRKTRKGFFNIF